MFKCIPTLAIMGVQCHMGKNNMRRVVVTIYRHGRGTERLGGMGVNTRKNYSDSRQSRTQRQQINEE